MVGVHLSEAWHVSKLTLFRYTKSSMRGDRMRVGRGWCMLQNHHVFLSIGTVGSALSDFASLVTYARVFSLRCGLQLFFFGGQGCLSKSVDLFHP